VRFANPATAARTESVEVSILEGSCSSRDSIYTASITRDSEGASPPNLGAGSYALLGRAITSTCGLVAYGCVQTTLPASSGATLEIVLDDVPEQRVCAGACASRCDTLDGGGDGENTDGGSVPSPTGDASDVPASMKDASTPPDAGPGSDPPDAATPPVEEAGVDAGPPCDEVSGPNGHCYRFNTDTLTFANAEAVCVTWGGHLVSFNDEAEELWTTTQAATLGGFGTPVRFWIGFTDGDAESSWKWTDGSTTASLITFDLGDAASVRFKTVSSTPYTHWGPNPGTTGNSEPNNSSAADPISPNPGEDCAESRADRVSGPSGITPRPEWDDQSCTVLKRSVCERL